MGRAMRRGMTAGAVLTVCLAAGPTTGPAANLLKDAAFDHVGSADGGWQAYAEGEAAVTAAKDAAAPAARPALVVNVTRVTPTEWQAQVFQSGLAVTKGGAYDLTFTGSATSGRTIGVLLQDAAAPYALVADAHGVALTATPKQQTVNFTATADCPNAKLAFIVGQATGRITLSGVSLTHADQ